MMYIISIILFAAVLVWDVTTDYNKWLKHIPVHHTKEAFIRAALLIPSGFFLLLPKLPASILYIIPQCFIIMGLIGSVWFELFDGWYNKKRGFKWRFNGTVDPDDSNTDKFLYNLGDFWEGVFKISLILIFLTLYILT